MGEGTMDLVKPAWLSFKRSFYSSPWVISGSIATESRSGKVWYGKPDLSVGGQYQPYHLRPALKIQPTMALCPHRVTWDLSLQAGPSGSHGGCGTHDPFTVFVVHCQGMLDPLEWIGAGATPE